MKTRIQQVSRDIAVDMLIESDTDLTELSIAKLKIFVKASAQLYLGYVDTKLLALWGLIPPTLMSDQAYLWLHVTSALKGHEFFLVRHSQCVVEEALKVYPTIVGHTLDTNTKAIRWLEWLGAKFGISIDGISPFQIKAKHG